MTVDRIGTKRAREIAAAAIMSATMLCALTGCTVSQNGNGWLPASWFKGWSTSVEVTDVTTGKGYTYLKAKNVSQRIVADESTVIANCDCDWSDLSEHVKAGSEYKMRWKSDGSAGDLHLDRIDVGETAGDAKAAD